MTELGRTLIVFGLVLLAVGGVLVLGGGRLSWLGNLPGDFVIRRGGFRLYLPLATCLLLSIVLSLVLALFRR